MEWLIGSGRSVTLLEWLPTDNILSAIISIEGKEGTSRSREEQEIIYFFLYFLHTICTFFIIVLENKRKIILISPICLSSSSSSVILLLFCDLLSQRMLNYLFVIPEMRNVGNSSSLNSGGRFQHFILKHFNYQSEAPHVFSYFSRNIINNIIIIILTTSLGGLQCATINRPRVLRQ